MPAPWPRARASSDVERADILFRLGVCRYKLSSIQTAAGLLDEALLLAERSGHPCDRLRAEILLWRSRCYRHQRDFLAARENVERALELAEALNDPATAANAYFQASLVAEREGHPGLARSYAERARSRYEEIADRAMVGRLLNNLGAFTHLLGRSEEAVEYLKDALRVLLDQGSDVEAAHVVCSLAEIHLGMGRFEDAESEARTCPRPARRPGRLHPGDRHSPVGARPLPDGARSPGRGSRHPPRRR